MDVIDHTDGDKVQIVLPLFAIQTAQAADIMQRILPEFIGMFLEKNRKYAKVDNSLGARGVFPDIYRKTGILKDRVWDGSDVVGEGTREVAMDLVGHLLLMIHMMDNDFSEGDGKQDWGTMTITEVSGAGYARVPHVPPVWAEMKGDDGPNYPDGTDDEEEPEELDIAVGAGPLFDTDPVRMGEDPADGSNLLVAEQQPPIVVNIFMSDQDRNVHGLHL